MSLRKPLPTPRTHVLKNKTDLPSSSKVYTESHKEGFSLETNPEYKEPTTVCNYNALNIHCDLTPSPSQSAIYASVKKKRSSGGESNTLAFAYPKLEPVEYEQIEVTKIGDDVDNKVRKASFNDSNSKVNSIYEAPYYNLGKAATSSKTQIQLKYQKGDMKANHEEKTAEAKYEFEGKLREGYYANIEKEKGKQMPLKQIEVDDEDTKCVNKESKVKGKQNRKSENEKVITKWEKDERKDNKSKTEDEEIENMYGSNENIYEPVDYFQQTFSASSVTTLLKPKAVAIIEPSPPIPPSRKEEMKLQARISNLDLTFTIKDFLDAENDYIACIEEALNVSSYIFSLLNLMLNCLGNRKMISKDLKRTGFSREGVLNYFGLLEDIHTFHKQILLKEFELCTANPQNIPTLFINHADKFHVYVERQRLIPNKSDLSRYKEILIEAVLMLCQKSANDMKSCISAFTGFIHYVIKQEQAQTNISYPMTYSSSEPKKQPNRKKIRDMYIAESKRKHSRVMQYKKENIQRMLKKKIKLERYVNITKERISEYIKTLQQLKYKYHGNNQKTNSGAIRMLENLYYQLEMIQKLKQVEDIYDKFKECGEIYLDRTFNVSINGTRKQDYLVYLCENIIIFTIFKKDNSYHCVLDIPIARCYCCVMKQSNIFEIGIKGKKRLTMEAESQAIKRRWCAQLRKVLNPDVFQEI